MLEKKITYDHLITDRDSIMVREITTILDNTNIISTIYRRHTIEPGSDTASEDKRTRLIASLIHTPQCIEKHKARIKQEQIALAEYMSSKKT